MLASLDNSQTNITPERKLFSEIRDILVDNYHQYGKASIVVYIPLDGPTAYTYKKEGFTVKGVFKGDYTKRNIKNLVDLLTVESDDFVEVSVKGLHSFEFFSII